jgi:hypothetical protein
MKKFGCGLGFVLLLLAGASALAEIVMQARGEPGMVSLGWLWYQIHGNSLVGFQASIEKNVGPAAWQPIQYLLTLQGWVVVGIPGVILGLSCLSLRRSR